MIAILLFLFAPAVDRLGSNDFRTREAASACLQRAGWLAIPALQKGACSTDLERAYRSAKILKRHRLVDVRILWICFRPNHWVAGCETVGLRAPGVDDCLRRWRLLAREGEPWPESYPDWSEPEQIRGVLNFARMRARNPTLPWTAVAWVDCLDPKPK